MKTKSSIHIAPGHNGYYAHNSRESFSHSQVFSDEENEYHNDAKTAFKEYQKEMYFRSEAYTARTGQRLQSRTVTHLSAIINLLDHHTPDDLTQITEHLEKTLDTVITQLAIHKDEGKIIHKETGEKLTSGIDFFMEPVSKKIYFDKEYTEELNLLEWEVEKNIHAHVEMLGIDSDGNSIKRNRLNRYYLQELQGFVAEVLGMERGQQQESYTRDQMNHIKSVMKPRDEYKDKKDYGSSFNHVAKQLGYFIPKKKRLDTHEFKAKMKSQNEIDNEKRKANELLDQKTKELKNRHASLADRDNEIEMFKQKVIGFEEAKKVAREKEKSYLLKISDFQEVTATLIKHNKELEQKNYELQYAKGWKKNGEPVEKNDLIKHLKKKGKKVSLEKQDYVGKYNVLLDDKKEVDDTNTQLMEENQDLIQELHHSSLGVDSLNEEVNELKDEVSVLTDKIQQLEKDKVIIHKKEHSMKKDIPRPRMRP